jgi:hypothetical protein
VARRLDRVEAPGGDVIREPFILQLT